MWDAVYSSPKVSKVHVINPTTSVVLKNYLTKHIGLQVREICPEPQEAHKYVVRVKPVNFENEEIGDNER